MKMQEPAKSVIVPTGHHGVDYGEKKKTEETSLAVPHNDRIGDRYAQYNNISDDDDDTEYDEDEEEEDGSGGLPVAVPSSSTGIVQQHQMPSSSDDNIVLPNTDPAMYGDVCVEKSKNVHLGNKTFYKGSVTIHQVVHTAQLTDQPTNPAYTSPPIDYSRNPSQDESNFKTSGCVYDVNMSDMSEYKVDVDNNRPIFQPNNESYEGTHSRSKSNCTISKCVSWCFSLFILILGGCIMVFIAGKIFNHDSSFTNSRENSLVNNDGWNVEAVLDTDSQGNRFINVRSKDRPTSSF